MKPLIQVLVVDDDAGIRELVKEILEENNFKTHPAKSGPEAVRATAKQKFDLILLDIRMPTLSGLWFCNAFKERKQTKKIPILMMSSQADAGTIKKATDLGAAGFLKKPFLPAQLLDAIREIISH